MFYKTKVSPVVFISVLAIMVACGEKSPTHYKLLPRKDMVYFLTQIHLKEALAQQQGFASIDSARVFYYQLLTPELELKGYTLADLDSSFVYYSRQPEVFDLMYQEVVDSLAVKESKVEF